MAKTKAGGSTRLGRDSIAKRLGVKRYGGQTVIPGNIIVRQRGSKFRAGEGTRMGADDTIYATVEGIVTFKKVKKKRFTGALKRVRIVSVEPAQ